MPERGKGGWRGAPARPPRGRPLKGGRGARRAGARAGARGGLAEAWRAGLPSRWDWRLRLPAGRLTRSPPTRPTATPPYAYLGLAGGGTRRGWGGGRERVRVERARPPTSGVASRRADARLCTAGRRARRLRARPAGGPPVYAPANTFVRLFYSWRWTHPRWGLHRLRGGNLAGAGGGGGRGGGACADVWEVGARRCCCTTASAVARQSARSIGAGLWTWAGVRCALGLRAQGRGGGASISVAPAPGWVVTHQPAACPP